MLNFEIDTVGMLALDFIESYSKSEIIGETVNVFENTIYLKTRDDNLICLTSKDIKSPINLNLNSSVNFLKFNCINKKAIRTSSGLKLDIIRFNLKNSKIYLSTQNYEISAGLQDRVLFSVDQLRLFYTLRDNPNDHSLFFNKLASLIRPISNSTQKHDLIKLSNQLSSFVGLGNGFTPSGDDFIVGFLFCLNKILLISNYKHIEFVITGNTNWASKKFIDYSQNCIVIEPLEAFVSYLLSGENGTKLPLMDLIRVGSSSGIYAGIGAIIATVFIFDRDFANLILAKLTLLK